MFKKMSYNMMLTQKNKNSNNLTQSENSIIKGNTTLKEVENSNKSSKKLNNLSSNSKTNCKGKKGCKTVISNTRLNLILDVDEQNIIDSEQEKLKAPDTKIDYVSGYGKNITEENIDKIIEIVFKGSHFNKLFDVKEYDCRQAIFKGGPAFEKMLKNEIGAKMLYHHNKESNTYTVFLSLSGAVLSELYSMNDMLSPTLLLLELVNLGLHMSRGDFAINDYQKRLEIDDVFNYCLNKNLCGPAVYGNNGKYDLKKDYFGKSVYMGSRESDAFLRVYDTYVLHDYHANRWELELKGRKAKVMQKNLIKIAKEYQKEVSQAIANNEIIEILKEKYNNKLLEYVQNVILSSVDFKDKSELGSNGNIGKLPSLEKWTEYRKYIRENYQKVRIKVEVKKTDLNRKMAWLNRSVKGSLAIVYQGLGLKGFKKYIESLIVEYQQKTLPDIVRKDNELMVTQLQRKGLYAVMNQKEITAKEEKTGVSFGIGYKKYEPNKPKIEKSKFHSMRQFGRMSDAFQKLLSTDVMGLYYLFENYPTQFDMVTKIFNESEKLDLINTYTTEPVKEPSEVGKLLIKSQAKLGF